ncbi:metal-dependent hydrolase [Halobaculum marinum]|uniref:Metal-dependent hydrolase n=1 Tax=Halobaculum marinum TaxID=3031996 RepID=A0ABD5WUB3_9EURY|nr:metal-dependent hydrolase [Halobaculum sp. DT55]
MGPVGHAIVAYLAWTTFTHLRGGRSPTTPEVWLVALGSQFPDLVDKPLAWSLSVLPAGRSLGHSLFTVVALAILLRRLVPPDRHSLIVPFLAAILTHDLTDAIAPLNRGEPEYVAYLMWPVVEQPQYDPPPPLLAAFGESVLHGLSGTGVVVIAVTVAVWLADGAPGLPRGRRSRKD